MDSVSVSSCESNHSEAEEGSVTPMDTPDEPQKKVFVYSLPIIPNVDTWHSLVFATQECLFSSLSLYSILNVMFIRAVKAEFSLGTHSL